MKRAFMQIYAKGSKDAVELYTRAFDAAMGYHETLPDGSYMHAELVVEGNVIAIGEAPADESGPVTGNTMQFCLQFEDGDEGKIGKAYDVLREGGSINVPLGPCFFSPCMADIVDRFGVRWCLFV